MVAHGSTWEQSFLFVLIVVLQGDVWGLQGLNRIFQSMTPSDSKNLESVCQLNSLECELTKPQPLNDRAVMVPHKGVV